MAGNLARESAWKHHVISWDIRVDLMEKRMVVLEHLLDNYSSRYLDLAKEKQVGSMVYFMEIVFDSPREAYEVQGESTRTVVTT